MSRQKKRTLVQSDLNPNFGPGLFMDNRAQHSANKACAQCRNFMNSLPKTTEHTPALINAQLDDALILIARYYWSDFDYENRVKRTEIKSELSKFAPTLKLLMDCMKDLSPLARQAINIELAKSNKQSEYEFADRFLQFENCSSSISGVIATFVEPKNKRTPGVRMKRACRSLIKIWEKLTEDDFSGALDTIAERSGNKKNPNDAFFNFGPQFVLTILRAIDPSIEIERVRNGLREALRDREKDGNS